MSTSLRPLAAAMAALWLILGFAADARCEGQDARAIDAVSPKEEGPPALDLWNRRIADHLSSGRHEDYEVLENWCSVLVKNRSRELDGSWTIDNYMQGFEDYFRQVSPSHNSWKDDLRKIHAWRAAFPQSSCVPIVEATYWYSSAWFTRGDNADDIPWAYRLFCERLAQADKTLDESRAVTAVNPAWYPLKLRTGLALAKQRPEMAAVLAASLKSYPDYQYSIFAMSTYLLPRSGGNWWNMDKFVRAMVAAADPSQKPIMYVNLYWYLSRAEGNPMTFFGQTPANWAEMKVGFDELMKRHPKSIWILNNYASFACKAGDVMGYRVLRLKIRDAGSAGFVGEAWASGMSPEVCDLQSGYGRDKIGDDKAGPEAEKDL